MKTLIHINQHVIKTNRRNNTADPVITCKTYKTNKYANEAQILDKDGVVVAKVIYRPFDPLACGAHVWIETHNEVNLITNEEPPNGKSTNQR
jgi:hypothetical protein